jgi:hypothetical protein
MRKSAILLLFAAAAGAASVALASRGFGMLLAGDVRAATTYYGQRCDMTLATSMPSPCGCPIPNNYTDFCSAVLPQDGTTVLPVPMCWPRGPYYCTAPNLSCGGQVYECPYANCKTAPPPPYPPSWGCQKTDKQDYCNHLWGCTTP